jgi:uncharacterized protein (DUF305 family)
MNAPRRRWVAALPVVWLLIAGLPTDAAPDFAPTSSSVLTKSPSRTQLVAAEDSRGSFNGTDVAWLQLTIAMHEKALPLIDRLRSRSDNPRLLEFATSLHESHSQELSTMYRLRREAGLSDVNPHEGHDMPGLVSDHHLAEVDQLTGSASTERAISVLLGHLQQESRLASSECQAGQHPAVTLLAAVIQHNRSQQTDELEQQR